MMTCFLTFPGNRTGHFMQIVSTGDTLHEMSKPVLWGKIEKYFSTSSAGHFTQTANR